jgi:hypothetical protein
MDAIDPLTAAQRSFQTHPAPNATLTTALQAAQAQAAASPWQEYRTGDGAVAYYNPTTGETAWTKPVSACDSSHN